MAAVTPKFKFGFQLKSGNSNVRFFSEASTQSFNDGDLVAVNTAGKVAQFTTPSNSTKTTSVSSGILGVAAKDASGTAGTRIPVYIITPEQEWEVHGAPSKKPSTATLFDEGDLVKLAYKAVTNYTLSNGTTSMTTTVGAWYAKHSAATNNGAVVVAYRRGEEGTKGGRLIVRFTSAACAMQY